MFAGKHAGLVIEEAELSSVYELISAQPHGSAQYRKTTATRACGEKTPRERTARKSTQSVPVKFGIGFQSPESGAMILQIKRAFGFLLRDTFYRMRINHGSSDITVAEQFLNGPDIIIGLQQMACITVAKRMR